jgi:predicted metallopeptidase
MCQTLPEFKKIKPSKIVISSTPSRTTGKGGLWACLLPLRFENGKRVTYQRRHKIREKHLIRIPCPKLKKQKPKADEFYLYYLYLSTPRFYNLSASEKLETLVHELYHINPGFNGDLRRFPGKNTMHGRSIKAYDQRIASLTQLYLKRARRREALSLLSLNHKDLLRAYGEIRFPRFREPEQNITQMG